jgi:glutathione S-transferase
MLEEKKIPYRMEKINMRSYGEKPQSFLDKVPSGLLPVIELDGRVITESAEIMMLLEEVRTAFTAFTTCTVLQVLEGLEPFCMCTLI